MRILLTNNTLHFRAGTELYIYDVAVELLRRGHQPVAFSPHHGEVAERLKAATVPVVSDPAAIATPPDVIHGHHHYETLIAALTFPSTPVVSFCHGWVPWEEEPLLHPNVMRYVAVSQLCRARVELEHGVSACRIRVLPNFVDVSRFRRRKPLPAKPKRALVFDNNATEDTCRPLRTACAEQGIELDIAGLASGRVVHRPEELLPLYDLVFAKGRAALEATTVGAAVILNQPGALGPIVTPENWKRVREFNFGLRLMTAPLTKGAALEQIVRYQAEAAASVCDRARSEASLETAVDKLEELYSEVVGEARNAIPNADASQRAAAEYLLRYAEAFKGRALALGEVPSLRAAKERAEMAQAALDSQLAAATARCRSEAEIRLRVEAELAVRDREVKSMRDSATWRTARWILDNPVAQALSPLVNGVGQYLRDGK